MRKFFFRIFVLLLIIVFSIIIYFGYFGINTDKFDVIIKSKANEVNQRVKLDFKKTKIHLNIRELNLAIKLQNPKILVDEDEINLSKLDLFLALNSFFTSDFLLKRAEVAFSKNDIKDLVKVTKIFKWIYSKGVSDIEMIKTFNCGVGFCVIVNFLVATSK